MNKKVIVGFCVGFVGIIVVIGLAYGLVHALHDKDEEEPRDQPKADAQKGECCKRVRLSGTTNEDDFYQEMMGDYTIYEDYPHLDFSQEKNVKHDWVKKAYPVYRHAMFQNDPKAYDVKYAYLYFYYNTEPRKEEQHCPEGCWILSMYDMTPNNFWYGFKYWYMKKKAGVEPPTCPDLLTANGSKFINQEDVEDKGLVLECAD